MSKIVAVEKLSLDGVMQAPGRPTYQEFFDGGPGRADNPFTEVFDNSKSNK